MALKYRGPRQKQVACTSWIKMKLPTIATLLLASLTVEAVDIEKRQGCPKVYTFGARETTVKAGYGTAGGLVNQIKAAFPGSGAEAIVYPACGGQASCGGLSYDRSQTQGTAAVVKAVTAYARKCPKTQIVLVGYSQVGPETRADAGLTFQGRPDHGQCSLRRRRPESFRRRSESRQGGHLHGGP